MKFAESVHRIVFVCYGNLCRSVLAEALMKWLLNDRQISNLAVESAGIRANPGYPPLPETVEVAREHGLDVARHRAKLLDATLIQWTDVILVMESYMKAQVQRMVGEKHQDRILLLGSFADHGRRIREIEDPCGGSIRDFRHCFKEIEKSVRGLLAVLVQEDPEIGVEFPKRNR